MISTVAKRSSWATQNSPYVYRKVKRGSNFGGNAPSLPLSSRPFPSPPLTKLLYPTLFHPLLSISFLPRSGVSSFAPPSGDRHKWKGLRTIWASHPRSGAKSQPSNVSWACKWLFWAHRASYRMHRLAYKLSHFNMADTFFWLSSLANWCGRSGLNWNSVLVSHGFRKIEISRPVKAYVAVQSPVLKYLRWLNRKQRIQYKLFHIVYTESFFLINSFIFLVGLLLKCNLPLTHMYTHTFSNGSRSQTSVCFLSSSDNQKVILLRGSLQ